MTVWAMFGLLQHRYRFHLNKTFVTKAECRAGHAPLPPNLAPGPVGSQPLLCYCYAKLV